MDLSGRARCNGPHTLCCVRRDRPFLKRLSGDHDQSLCDRNAACQPATGKSSAGAADRGESDRPLCCLGLERGGFLTDERHPLLILFHVWSFLLVPTGAFWNVQTSTPNMKRTTYPIAKLTAATPRLNTAISPKRRQNGRSLATDT